jgi:hypothetical protein
MSEVLFPRTTVDGISVSRMIIGTNWILGYSHTGAAADTLIKNKHNCRNATADMLEVFLENGVDTIMGPLNVQPMLLDAMKLAEDNTGRALIRIDTPIINVDDSPAARKEAWDVIADCKAKGAAICFPHHSSAEQLVCKNTQTIDRLPDYLKMVRDNGMVPGLSAHMPELIVYSDLNEYDVQSYVQIYNCMGFLMQVEIEYIHKVIWNAKKPVMTIKSMAAGRVSPFVGLNFSWATLRPQDMVTVGCLTPEEACEDIEISLAAFEHRAPDLEGRSSPKKTSIMK